MSDLVTVQGMVVSAVPVGEYDKRLVLLTKERGKIAAFAKGARRPNSPFLAAANPFVLGSFTLYEGRSSYTVNQVAPTHYFTELAQAQPGVYYGFYFLELADYYGREGIDAHEMVNLLYVSLKALLNAQIPNGLVCSIYEFRLLVIQGEYPQIFQCVNCGKAEGIKYFSQGLHGLLCQDCRQVASDLTYVDESAQYALQYIATAPLGRLYTFTVSEQVRRTLRKIVHTYLQRNTEKQFKSLEILDLMVAGSQDD